MFNGEILNKAFLEGLAVMGHRDILMVVDAAFPIPETGCRRVDLAITKDLPNVETVLTLLTNNFIYEECFVGEEQKLYNKLLFEKVTKIINKPITIVPHDEIMYSYVKKAKVIIRTGAFEPWCNMVFVSGIDVPVWFEKEGTVLPNFYKEMAEKKE